MMFTAQYPTRHSVPPEDLLARLFLSQLAPDSEKPNETGNKAHKGTPSKVASNDVTSTLTTNNKKNKIIAHSPPTYREEDDDKITVSLDVPGFEESGMEIVLEDKVLSVSGKRTNKWGDTFVFRHRFPVDPEVVNSDPSTVVAELTDGVLGVSLLKRKTPKPRVIRITTSNKGGTTATKTTEDNKDAAPLVKDKKVAPKVETADDAESCSDGSASHEKAGGFVKVNE